MAEVLDYLDRHGCPNPQRGEGSPLFPPSNGLLTPDLVAGEFRGPTHPDTFFIDVVTPSGDYVTRPLAGAPQSAAFFNKQIKDRGQWGMGDIPDDISRPLVAAVRKKAAKYSARRGGSAALGVAAYFDERSKSGGHVITMIAYMKALNDALGPVNQKALHLLLDGHQTMIVCPVSWDEPLCFLLQVVSGASMRGVLLLNTHERVKAVREHEVATWAHAVGGPT